MDQGSVAALLKLAAAFSPAQLIWIVAMLLATPFGVVAMLMIFYWANERKRSQTMHDYREDTRMILTSYGEHMARQAKYYDDNVKLVQAWEKIANGFADQVILNTQTMQRMVDVCINNQFCPNVRIPK